MPLELIFLIEAMKAARRVVQYKCTQPLRKMSAVRNYLVLKQKPVILWINIEKVGIQCSPSNLQPAKTPRLLNRPIDLNRTDVDQIRAQARRVATSYLSPTSSRTPQPLSSVRR